MFMPSIPLNEAEFGRLLLENDSFLLLCHQSPDCDTLGSAFGLMHFLKTLGKRVMVACSDPFPEQFYFLYADSIQNPRPATLAELEIIGVGKELLKPVSGKEESAEAEEDFLRPYLAGDSVFQPQTVLACDVADPKLLGGALRPWLRGVLPVHLAVDHHQTHVHFAQKALVDPAAAATCEILAKILRDLRLPLAMPPVAAACLFTGLCTDTGCFKYASVTAQTHGVAAWLMSMPFPADQIIRLLFMTKTRERQRLEQFAWNKMEFLLEQKLALAIFTQAEMTEAGVAEADFDGIAAMPVLLEGVEVGVTAKEKREEPGAFKVSMRASGDVDVSAICGLFAGGGHKKAGGCLIRGTPEAVRRQIVEAVEKAFSTVATGVPLRIVI